MDDHFPAYNIHNDDHVDVSINFMTMSSLFKTMNPKTLLKKFCNVISLKKRKIAFKCLPIFPSPKRYSLLKRSITVSYDDEGEYRVHRKEEVLPEQSDDEESVVSEVHYYDGTSDSDVQVDHNYYGTWFGGDFLASSADDVKISRRWSI